MIKMNGERDLIIKKKEDIRWHAVRILLFYAGELHYSEK